MTVVFLSFAGYNLFFAVYNNKCMPFYTSGIHESILQFMWLIIKTVLFVNLDLI